MISYIFIISIISIVMILLILLFLRQISEAAYDAVPALSDPENRPAYRVYEIQAAVTGREPPQH